MPNTQALFYLSGMPLCDNKTAIKRATALFVQAASIGDNAAGSAHYHLAKGFFFSTLSFKNLGKRKHAVDACKLHINKVFAVGVITAPGVVPTVQRVISTRSACGLPKIFPKISNMTNYVSGASPRCLLSLLLCQFTR